MNRPLNESRLTPLNDNYGTCERAAAELWIYPADLRQEDVGQMLGLVPTRAQNEGDQIPLRDGRSRTARRTFWCLSSEGSVESLDVRRHLDWLLDRLAPSANQLRELQTCDRLQMAVRCSWCSRGGHGGPTLWPEQMRRLAELNLECGFEIQFHGETFADLLPPA